MDYYKYYAKQIVAKIFFYNSHHRGIFNGATELVVRSKVYSKQKPAEGFKYEKTEVYCGTVQQY